MRVRRAWSGMRAPRPSFSRCSTPFPPPEFFATPPCGVDRSGRSCRPPRPTGKTPGRVPASAGAKPGRTPPPPGIRQALCFARPGKPSRFDLRSAPPVSERYRLTSPAISPGSAARFPPRASGCPRWIRASGPARHRACRGPAGSSRFPAAGPRRAGQAAPLASSEVGRPSAAPRNPRGRRAKPTAFRAPCGRSIPSGRTLPDRRPRCGDHTRPC